MIENLVVESIMQLGDSFKKNELAYLAATSKIELPIRDRWAYLLQQTFLGQFEVAREWHRTDLAIVKKQTPAALIELKAMYTLDALFKPEGINGYLEKMQFDAVKAKNLATDNTLIFTVLLATHPKSQFPIELDKVVKYLTPVNKCLQENDLYEGKVKMRAEQIVAENLKHKTIIAQGTLVGGEAFGSEIDVLYWVVKE